MHLHWKMLGSWPSPLERLRFPTAAQQMLSLWSDTSQLHRHRQWQPVGATAGAVSVESTPKTAAEAEAAGGSTCPQMLQLALK